MDLVQMIITGTLSSTGNLKPNLKASPSQDLASRKNIFISISMIQTLKRPCCKIAVLNILTLKNWERTMCQVRYKVETLSVVADVRYGQIRTKCNGNRMLIRSGEGCHVGK